MDELQFHSEEMLGKAGVFEIPGLELNEEDEKFKMPILVHLYLLEKTKHLREKLKFSFFPIMKEIKEDRVFILRFSKSCGWASDDWIIGES